MELLTKEDQSLIAITLREGVQDRGSHCLVRDDQSVIFHEVSADLVLQAGYTPENSPSWFLNVFHCTASDLRDKIKSLMADGWSVTRSQFDDLEED